jgi:hypothetical protein
MQPAGCIWQPEHAGKVLYASNKSSWITGKESARWIINFNEGLKNIRKIRGLLIMIDNFSSQSMSPNAKPPVWDVGNFRFRGFKMSYTITDSVYLHLKTTVTRWVSPSCKGSSVHSRQALAACEKLDQEEAENMTPTILCKVKFVEQALKNFVTSVQENRDTPISFSY